MQICEIINVGTELLLGEILNTNAQFLCRELAAMGISVQRVNTVGDNPHRLREDFLHALSRSDIVLLTGGLGPTQDDLTKEVVAEALTLPLEEDAKQMQCIKDFFAVRGLPFSQNNRKQAMVPHGCTVLYNENGTAPGIYIETGEKVIVLLPGPPHELQHMFAHALAPLLQQRGEGVIVSHHLRTMGIGEGRMAELCNDFLDSTNPTVAPYAKDGEAYLRVSAAASTKSQAEDMCDCTIKKLQKVLGNYAYSIDKPLERVVLELLHAQNKTLAIAESCTGGGICKQLTDLPGASRVFGWGVVTYADEAKQNLLNVSRETISSVGAVSAECAQEMARGMLARSGADVALAVTGMASPADDTEKPAGLIFLHATDGTQHKSLKLETGRSDRAYNRSVATKQALDLVRQLLMI
ncbi:MAG: competence/damage-inducible protein A [Oscillospiraceae bacterium]|nr:competence/damage-inducible protein A [Oscillospiraceae bacterium]